MGRAPTLASIAAALALSAGGAMAADALKATIGQRGNWDSAIVHLGSKAGIFEKHGLEVEAIYTSASGETLQR
jgi:NitT/TauT family transport system substrate-binding protein